MPPQDELQCLEHPILGSVREMLAAERHAFTAEGGAATPVLVAGAERRCALDTRRLYGNRFAAASSAEVREALELIVPPTRTNLIAIAAPAYGDGAYTRDELDKILATAYAGFAAAVAESARLWPGAPVEIRTGFWGCGAFGGNRHVMTILQLAAARLARVARLRFYAFDDAGQTVLADARAFDLGDEPIAAVHARGLRWGVSDGS